jgi:hypothetical protein
MVGRIFITRSGYDPEKGRHVKDPYLGPVPTLGACRPDLRKRLQEGDHIFVISGRVLAHNQFVMGGFEVAAKISAQEAYTRFPELRLSQRPDGQLTGNIIVNGNGEQHELDDHNSFTTRIRNYIIGASPLILETSKEVALGREQTLAILRETLRRKGKTPIEVVGRWGSQLTERQVGELREWLSTLKRVAA